MFSEIQARSPERRSPSAVRQIERDPCVVCPTFIPIHMLTSPVCYYRTGVISTRSLCIESRKAVWVLYVDATCINYDGNAFDATLIAMVSALQNSTSWLFAINLPAHDLCTAVSARLPKATFDEDTGRVLCTRKEKIPLQINRFPLSMSFGILDGYVRLALVPGPHGSWSAQHAYTDRPDVVRGATAGHDIHRHRRRERGSCLSGTARACLPRCFAKMYRHYKESV